VDLASHDLSLVAFTINIAESNFRHTQEITLKAADAAIEPDPAHVAGAANEQVYLPEATETVASHSGRITPTYEYPVPDSPMTVPKKPAKKKSFPKKTATKSTKKAAKKSAAKKTKRRRPNSKEGKAKIKEVGILKVSTRDFLQYLAR
jgi:hypothetical protein